MLTLRIVNDCTGTEKVASYDWRVFINSDLLAAGRVTGHKRADGWRALVAQVARVRPVRRSKRKRGKP